MKTPELFIKNIADYLGRLICPPRCVCCDEVFDIDDDRVLCPKCTEQILWRNNISINSNEANTCMYLLPYDSWYARKLIAHAKYTSSKAFLKTIGGMFYKHISDRNLQNKIDVITFSPRRPSQIRLYGFDQSEEMAKALSEVSGIPYEALLKRHGVSFAQKRLTENKRKQNVKGKFLFTGNVSNKSVLLIDDVRTTGATLFECANTLKENGATDVYILTISAKNH